MKDKEIEKNKVGRPTTYDYELCKEVCDLVASGMNVVKALESDERFPNWTTFRRWKQLHEELNTLYVKSIQDKAIHCESVIDEYKQMLLSGEIDPATYNTLTQTEKWKMSKFYPKMFGDKVDVTTDGEKVNQPMTAVWQVVDSSKTSKDK